MSARRALLLIVVEALWLDLYAQTMTGGIRGVVRDPYGGLLSGATIEISGPALQGTRVGVTDEEGSFAFPSLPPGEGYLVSVRRAGFRTTRTNGIRVSLGLHQTIPFILQPAVAEEVVVTASSPLIDVTMATTAINVTQSEFEHLPARRTFQSLAAIAPEASLEIGERQKALATSPAIAGATPLENNYVIEGVSTRDVVWGSSGSDLTMNFVQEVQVMTGGYGAEFGGSTGGVLNVITKSGGNDVTGEVFAYYQSDDWSSKRVRRRSRGSVTKGDGIDSRDVGVAVGGPIRHDALWFFAAWDPTRRTTYTREFIDPAGRYVDEQHELDSDADLFAGKLTWAISPRHQIVASTFGDPQERRGWLGNAFSDATAALARDATGTVNEVARYEGWFGERAMLEARIGRNRGIDDLSAITDVGRTVPRQYEGVVSHGGFGWWRDASTSRDSLFIKGSVPFRNHRVLAGVDLQKITYEEASWNHDFRFLPQEDIEGFGTADVMEESLKVADGSGSVAHHAAFLQNEWNITQALRVTIGARYERQQLETGEGMMVAAPSDWTVQRREPKLQLTGEWAPRVGIVWDPRRNGRSKLYAHAGRYFESMTSWASYKGNGVESAFRAYYSANRHGSDDWYNPAGSPLNDHWTLYESSGFGVDQAAMTFDPNLAMQYQDEIRSGGEVQIGSAWSLGAHLAHRKIGRVVEDVGLLPNPANPRDVTAWLVTNPGEGTFGSTYTRPRREYDSASVVLQRRPLGNWFVHGSFAWARAEGDYEGLYRSPTGQLGPNLTTDYDYPGNQKNSSGRLPPDRPYQLKAFGWYRFPIGLTLGTSFLLSAGSPVSALGPDRYGQDNMLFLRPRGSEGRTPAYSSLDLHADYTIPIRGAGLSVIVDVFNATDNHEVIFLDQAYIYRGMPGMKLWRAPGNLDEFGNPKFNPDLPSSSYFKTPRVYQLPRTAQVGVRYRF